MATAEGRTPSPFAASLLFGYVANYIYDGDAPLAERRAQALSVDQAQLAELIGDVELRDLLDPVAVDVTERELQHLDARWHARSADGVHDLLLRLGDLGPDEIAARSADGVAASALPALEASRRIVQVSVGGERRYIAAEDAARYRDGVGAPPPPGLPEAFLEPAADPLVDLARRYARTHGPFSVLELAGRLGVPPGAAGLALAALAASGRVVEGEFRPGGHGREWCDTDVLRSLRRRSLARLRREVEPVDGAAFARFLAGWHALGSPRAGLDALLDVVEQLQGMPLAASVLESEILPARVAGYEPGQLDTLMAAGEVTWVGVEPLGDRDGRIALYLTDHLTTLAPAREPGALDERATAMLEHLRRHGSSFFGALHEAAGGGFPRDSVEALWSLVWAGLVTNDTLHPLRAHLAAPERTRRSGHGQFRSRRLVPPAAEGRWSAVPMAEARTPTVWATAVARQLLARHGVVTREAAALESLAGGFSAVYPVLRRLEDTGRVRRGYFVAGLGAAQFAEPGAVDRLRAREADDAGAAAVTLAATDPANPYGAWLPWPSWPGSAARGASRAAGARVVLVGGRVAAWIGRGRRQLLVALPDAEPDRSAAGRALAAELVRVGRTGPEGLRGWLIEEINGAPAAGDDFAPYLLDAGFTQSGRHLQLRVARMPRPVDA
ncbi:MAG: crosslink repair DNA glycosylase YcaQ family protein [Dehalococcoidia bacterium]